MLSNGLNGKLEQDLAALTPRDTEAKPAIEGKPLQIINAAAVDEREVEFLWEPYQLNGYVTLFSGPEGVGKSWVFCAISAGLTVGRLPLTPEFEPRNVLYFAREDAPEDALVPRLRKCGADLRRVSIVTEQIVFDEKGLNRVERYIESVKPAWVIIDPLFAYSDLTLDLNKPHHARQVTTALEDITKRHRISMSYLIHFNKGMGGGDARAAVSSSQEFSNAARSIILIGKDPSDENRRALVHRKHNYSPKGKSIGYRIKDGHFAWQGESKMTERDVVGRSGSSEEVAEKHEAVMFLQEFLADGPVEATTAVDQASVLGITDHQLRTARGKLGITPYSTGFGKEKKWYWELSATPKSFPRE